MVCEHSDVFASSCAIARAFPIFSRRSSSSRRAEKKNVFVEFLIVGQDSSSLDVAELEVGYLFHLNNCYLAFFIQIHFEIDS